MRLVYLSPVPWKSFTQRPHKFVQWFHCRTGGPVLWVDPYITRFPRWNDLSIYHSYSDSSLSESTPSWLTVISPGALPIEPIPGSSWINRLIWKSAIRSIDDFLNNNSKSMIVIGKPSCLGLLVLDRYCSCPTLYDAMDDFPAFYLGLSRYNMTLRERDIVDKVETVWVSSTLLYERWNRYHNSVYLVHNALDSAILPESTVEFSQNDRKVFGYVGTIGSWFDWAWVLCLALERPNDVIRLIGPVFQSSPERLPHNIELLPVCSHREALNAMMDFDVGLIPFKKTRLTMSIDPIKYYEYRALSLPILSTEFGEMRYRSDISSVFISKSMTDVALQAASALQFDRDSEAAQAFAIENSWNARFDASGLLP